MQANPASACGKDLTLCKISAAIEVDFEAVDREASQLLPLIALD